MVLVQSNFHKQKTSTTLSMLSDGKNWIAMPASFMASQSWKDSLHQKKMEGFLKKLDSSFWFSLQVV